MIEASASIAKQAEKLKSRSSAWMMDVFRYSVKKLDIKIQNDLVEKMVAIIIYLFHDNFAGPRIYSDKNVRYHGQQAGRQPWTVHEN